MNQVFACQFCDRIVREEGLWFIHVKYAHNISDPNQLKQKLPKSSRGYFPPMSTKHSFSNKLKISVSQVCRFLNMRDYPVIVTEDRKLFFRQYETFENYYLPLLVSVNPGCDPMRLRTLARAKWREVILSSDTQPQINKIDKVTNPRKRRRGAN